MLNFCDEFLASQRMLVISPHADDETYGCAGSIARIKSLGGEVYVILVSVADLAHYGKADDGSVKTVVSHQTRLDEFAAVMRYLKVDDWEVLFTDAQTHLSLDTVPRKHLVRLLESDARLSIDNLQPTMVMIPAISYNQDHEALFRAGVTATRPGAPGQKYTVPFVLTYDNTSLFWSGDGTRFHPNVYIDVSSFLDTKISALKMHASQVRGPLYHGSPEGLELATRTRGRETSLEAAEGFCLLRGVF
ncbi:MAG TPA: PIG-L family deacetylase [Pseudonocardiaceae bacterium]|jgi:LmbE family N-acetylglucosaminyl deacetylase|nr:PIG-L family deacetylase [Pseudonocardiaceae bacterium]